MLTAKPWTQNIFLPIDWFDGAQVGDDCPKSHGRSRPKKFLCAKSGLALMANIRLSILKRWNYAMSEGSKTALPQDWLVLAIFGIVTAAGATGQSAWFIIYGILCLVARDIAHYWDIICKAWSLPDWRATVFVWWNLFTQGACFAFALSCISFKTPCVFERVTIMPSG